MKYYFLLVFITVTSGVLAGPTMMAAPSPVAVQQNTPQAPGRPAFAIRLSGIYSVQRNGSQVIISGYLMGKATQQSFAADAVGEACEKFALTAVANKNATLEIQGLGSAGRAVPGNNASSCTITLM